jgi:hypothetical protein
MKGRQYNLKISFQCICMFSVSETVRGTHIYIFFPPRSCNCRFKIYARSLKYGYLTIGGTVCSCIRFCTQTDMFPPPPLSSVGRLWKKGKAEYRDWKPNAPESGQMYPAICGQVINKKYAPCLGPRFKQAASNFFCYRSARQNPVYVRQCT